MKTITENELKFFQPFTAQRRELRKIHFNNEIKSDWEKFVFDSDLKVLKISDALNISLHEISITYNIIELLKMYDELCKVKKTTKKKQFKN